MYGGDLVWMDWQYPMHRQHPNESDGCGYSCWEDQDDQSEDDQGVLCDWCISRSHCFGVRLTQTSRQTCKTDVTVNCR